MGYLIARWLLGSFFRLVWRPRIVGVEHIPATGPVIIASNHLSFIDSVVIPLVVPRRVRFLAKAEYFEGTGLRGWVNRAFFTAVDAVPVNRDSQRNAMASLRLAMDVLAQGTAFGIYPEGTRSRDGRLYQGRTGVGWLALESGAPVVPVALVGTDGRLVGIVSRHITSQQQQYGPCLSVTEATAKALLNKPLFPIALAPAQYLPKH